MSQFLDWSSQDLAHCQEAAVTSRVTRAFAKMVRDYMAQRGWNDSAFAERVKPDAAEGSAVSYLSKILRGKVRPPLERMEQWADLLRIDGADRRRFMLLAELAHGPERIESEFLRLSQEVSELRELARAAGLLPGETGR